MADVDTLIKDLKTGDYYSRSAAARALGEIGGEKAAAALIEALNDEDDWVQEYAAGALGKIAYRPASDALGRILKSENYKVRCAAVEALGRIGGDERDDDRTCRCGGVRPDGIRHRPGMRPGRL